VPSTHFSDIFVEFRNYTLIHPYEKNNSIQKQAVGARWTDDTPIKQRIFKKVSLLANEGPRAFGQVLFFRSIPDPSSLTEASQKIPGTV
jgi:hypothetical protein